MDLNKSTTIDIKRQNRQSVLKFVCQNEITSRQDIAFALGMSMPTVLQNIKELQELGLVKEFGQYESTGGRKAAILKRIDDAFFSIGVDVTRNHISIILINLVGKIISKKRIQFKYENTDSYYQHLGQQVINFVEEQADVTDKLLGVGISLPGIFNESGTVFTDSHALVTKDIPCERISKWIPWNCTFLNDANAAGLAELQLMPENSTMVYISLNNYVGGSIFFEGKLYKGQNQRSGEFGHMRLVPDGEQCYCGQMGCVDSYCSATSLTKRDDRLEDFFDKLGKNEKEYTELWSDYLKKLALAVINLRMSFDCDIVIGGYVGGFLEPWLPELRELAGQLNPFESECTYLRVCKYKYEASACGAALQQVARFIENI